MEAFEAKAVQLFHSDPDMRSAMLSMLYRAPPLAPPSLVEAWYLCKKIADEAGITRDDIIANIPIEIALRGPVSLTHNCDVLCKPTTPYNIKQQEALKREIAQFGVVYSGSCKRILEKIAEVMPIKYRTSNGIPNWK